MTTAASQERKSAEASAAISAQSLVDKFIREYASFEAQVHSKAPMRNFANALARPHPIAVRAGYSGNVASLNP